MYSNLHHIIKPFFLLFFYCGFAQQPSESFKIDYADARFEGNIVKDYTLFFDDKSALYIEKKVDRQKDKVTQEEANTTILIDSRSNKTPNFYFKYKDELYCRIVNYSDALLMKDLPYTIDWDISHEATKNIEGYLCKKATASFRGNNYQVWYTPEIPTSFGPWKLHGLSGAILEVYTDNDVIHIVATKIEKVKDDNTLLEHQNQDYSQALSYEEYRLKVDELAEAFLKKISARMPKGTKPLTIDKNCTDCGPRLEVYEK